MFDLTGKFALVTGATGGIGGAIAAALHAQGATVGLSGTREAVLQEVAAKLGSRVHVLPCNLGDADAVNGLIGQAEAAMGQVDILVNNAGITRDQLIMMMPEEDWDTVITTNLKSAFNCSKAAVKTMMRQRSGRIINISSVSGVMGNGGQTNYSASKAGLI
ncbi:MAG: SDR family NAD(P)-dependent oxidoreductase, partial [Ferrovibrio sp.]